MPVDRANLLEIVARASFLYERMDNEQIVIDGLNPKQEQIDSRLVRWCQVAARGDWEKFYRRMTWDNLDIQTVKAVLGGEPVVSGNLPDWAVTLQQIIQKSGSYGAHAHKGDNLLSDVKLVPFQEVLQPVILLARQKLITAIGGYSSQDMECIEEQLCPEAYAALEISLINRIANISVTTLYDEFSRSNPNRDKILSDMLGDNQDNLSREYYNEFVDLQLKDGLLSLFQTYPVLGRLLATTVMLWVDTVGEFIQRLKADRLEIETAFEHFNKNPLGKVQEIKPDLSDPHNGGRTVFALTFESELKLIYKPKNLDLEVAYNQLLDWCHKQGYSLDFKLEFKLLQVLNKETHGWVECVEHLPCADLAAVGRFYQRAGAQLCLLYVLGATDFHCENLIANGEHLVLVDLETVMRPLVNRMEKLPEVLAADRSAANTLIRDSVLSTAMLPQWQLSRNNAGDFSKGSAYDVSGLGSVDVQETDNRVPVWKYVNTDYMQLVYETFPLPVQKNVLLLNGETVIPNDYVDDIVLGFEQMYGFIMEHHTALKATSNPLAAFQTGSLRFLVRPTHFYSACLRESLAPAYLHDGVDWSIQLDLLARVYVEQNSKPEAWVLLHEETRALQQLDIPYFRTSTDSLDLTLGVQSPIKNIFKESGLSHVSSLLQRLSSDDLTLQVALIRDAFYAKIARGDSTALAEGIAQESKINLISPGDSEQLVEAAWQIAEVIASRAVRGVDEKANWIGLIFKPGYDRYQLEILTETLYDGNYGITLFLAALTKVTGSNEFRQLAVEALQPLHGFLQLAGSKTTKEFIAALGIGGAVGFGSLIYAGVKIGQLLELELPIADATRIAELISPSLIAQDTAYDIVSGGAGAILGLLALYGETGFRAILDKAILCGQHLLKHQNAAGGWINFYPVPLTGFSHGAAGIAYALLRLYAVTGDVAYKDAAVRAVAYENSVFSKEAGNWPDLRYSPESKFMTSWCHGAPGIGLARLGGLSILDTEEIRQDIEVALLSTHQYSKKGVDNLCCGEFGRLETLLVGATRLARPDLLESARSRAAQRIATARASGGYQLFPNLPPTAFMPTFFLGASGIGYSLLRLAYPDSLPSVLLWD